MCWHVSPYENRNILDPEMRQSVRMISSVKPETRLVLLNFVGLVTLITFTGLVYFRTQEPLILLVGGLIAVVSVVGAMMRKS